MPKQRTYKKRQNPYKKRVRVYGTAGKQLYKDVMYLKTVINSEPHNFPQSLSYNIDSAGAVDSLCTIAEGDGKGNRTGTSILPRFLTCNFNINKNLAGPNHESFRIIIFRYWGESTSAAPSVSIGEVLQTSDCLSFLNDDNTGAVGDRERRIEIHKSKLFTLDNVASISRTFKWNITVNGMGKNIKDHIKFRSSAEEHPVSGGFYFLTVSDNATAANKSTLDFRSKINFYDN